MATILSLSDAAITKCAQHIQEGNLVAFPTETVYGLGANALDGAACRRVYEVKGRPPTDPLICHVLDFDRALKLWVSPIPYDVENVIRCLATAFWPGALTIVYQAASHVPDVVCGGTPCVGVRVPQGPVARRLIEAAGVPIAAPSANRFGHISPTTAQHVFGDLSPYDSTLLVLDDGVVEGTTLGIESTVARVHSGDDVEILRKGNVTFSAIQSCLSRIPNVTVRMRDTLAKPKGLAEPQDGPGQLLKHYAPCIPTFLLREIPTDSPLQVTTLDGTNVIARLANTVVIDYDGRYPKSWREGLLRYMDISPSGDPDEAAHQLYATLRQAEAVEGAQAILLPSLLKVNVGRNDHIEEGVLDAVADRLFRSASGQECVLH